MLKIRKENGITLISLIVTIIILVIITYVSVNLSMNLSGTANFQNIHTYLLLIETKAEFLANKDAIGELGEDGFYGELQSYADLEKAWNDKNPGKDEKEKWYQEGEEWYKLDQRDLNDMGIEDAKEKDRILC